MQQLITEILAFFHRRFFRFMPFQTFRYLVCGGGNTLLDLGLFYIFLHFVFGDGVVHIGVVAISGYIAAMVAAFLITFPTGFLLNKYIVFSDSNLRSRVQLIRYFLLVAVCFLMNYACMKLFVEYCHIWPTIAKIMTIVVVVSFSYVTQKRFTFKVKVQ
ncbi:GtrA family protein [Chitinophaga lutea]